ncbi:unnamed protein product [Lathyrus sativus]|nr:unnamed protein product [Lathyrus sativus]
MMNPYRGRGRDYGRGGRGSNNMLPQPESNIPLIGDWTTVYKDRKMQQLPASSAKREDIASSSSNKTTSYKEVAVNNPPQEQMDYFENPVTEKIMYIDDEDIKINPNDGWSIKTRYLESRGYPGLHGKSRPNLKILLTVTESVTITHHYQNNNPESFINFSKCHINKILLSREWGLNSNAEKAIRIAEGKYIYFNYWDYVQAFTQAFYYQNPKNKHSWFFSINEEMVNKPIPNWFYEWWAKFGPSLEILPKEILNLYNPWYDNSPLIVKNLSDNLITGQCPLLFFIKFQIPWIWRWTITISRNKFNIPILERNFFYKWWNKMSSEDVQNKIKLIEEAIAEDQNKKVKEQSSQQMSMENLKNLFKKKYPNESEDEIMVRILDHMKNQFFSTFPSKASKDEDSSMKTSSSMGSMDSHNFEGLAGEGQADEATAEDFWDAMIQSLKEKRKAKN